MNTKMFFHSVPSSILGLPRRNCGDLSQRTELGSCRESPKPWTYLQADFQNELLVTRRRMPISQCCKLSFLLFMDFQDSRLITATWSEVTTQDSEARVGPAQVTKSTLCRAATTRASPQTAQQREGAAKQHFSAVRGWLTLWKSSKQIPGMVVSQCSRCKGGKCESSILFIHQRAPLIN